MERLLILFIAILLASSVSAWTRTMTFESGVVGQQAQGSADSFTYAGTNVQIDSTHVHSGSKAARIHWVQGAGDNFPIAVGQIEFDRAGLPLIYEGGEVWYRAYWYNPSDFDFCGTVTVKQMRLTPSEGGSYGQQSIFSQGNEFSYSCESPDYTCISWTPDCDGDGPWVAGSSRSIPTGRWYNYEYYLKFLPGSAGILRVWEDGVLIIERHGDIYNKGDIFSLAQIAGVWNGGPCKEQSQWVDDIVLTTDTPSSRDAAGNPMIGPTGVAGNSAICGSNGCESGETCSNCQQDCGACVCNPDWQCTAWSSCSNSQQTRTCTDSNSCGTTAGKPALSQSCSSPSNGITVDSTYEGYSISFIDDNMTDANGGTSTTWSSDESASAHWVLFTFPQTKELSNVDIYWAYNSYRQQYMSSQELHVQYWDGSQYVTRATITNTGSVDKSSVSFAEVSTPRLRLYQPANRGVAVYPNVLWLAEVDYGNCAQDRDIDCSGCIEHGELLNYISHWKTGQVTLASLMEAIRLWKNGC